MIKWHDAINQLTPHMYKISTPNGVGTGWLLSYIQNSALIVIATAAHVIEHAHAWDLPIRIFHEESGESTLLHKSDRAVVLNYVHDTAVIVLNESLIPHPKEAFPLLKEGFNVKPGVEIGWLGYPAIQGAGLSFFSGKVSSFDETNKRYFVDGVAINGVSGGPTFRLDKKAPELMGVVTAYIANRATGDTLPGVALVQDVIQFHEISKSLKSLDDAKKKESALPEEPPKEKPPKEEPPV